jgi:periplasmic copper chaperone A
MHRTHHTHHTHRTHPTRSTHRSPGFGRLLALAVVVSIAMVAPQARAHDFKAGGVVVDHPYAVPTAAGSTDGAAYLRGLKNTGSQADALIGAQTAAAAAVHIQRREGGNTSTRWVEADAVPLPAGSQTPLRHDGPWQLTLVGLKAPLKPGDSFDLTLQFRHAGRLQVPVTVVQPRSAADRRGP